MTEIRPPQTLGEDPETRHFVIRRLLQVVFSLLIQAVTLFLASGRLDWGWAWLYVGVSALLLAVNIVILVPRHPEMVAERAQIKPDAKRWDRALAGVVSLYGPVGTLLVAGFDARFGWSPTLNASLHLAGFALFVLGFALLTWAMTSNRFFSGLVRIQVERGHTVQTGGPYASVRHPGYLGMTIFILAMPLMLGSLWAFLPAGIAVATLMVRTVLEDRTLQAELDGYAEYARRVRYRLIPRLW